MNISAIQGGTPCLKIATYSGQAYFWWSERLGNTLWSLFGMKSNKASQPTFWNKNLPAQPMYKIDKVVLKYCHIGRINHNSSEEWQQTYPLKFVVTLIICVLYLKKQAHFCKTHIHYI